MYFYVENERKLINSIKKIGAKFVDLSISTESTYHLNDKQIKIKSYNQDVFVDAFLINCNVKISDPNEMGKILKYIGFNSINKLDVIKEQYKLKKCIFNFIKLPALPTFLDITSNEKKSVMSIAYELELDEFLIDFNNLHQKYYELYGISNDKVELSHLTFNSVQSLFLSKVTKNNSNFISIIKDQEKVLNTIKKKFKIKSKF
jgi:hypothetical protein